MLVLSQTINYFSRPLQEHLGIVWICKIIFIVDSTPRISLNLQSTRNLGHFEYINYNKVDENKTGPNHELIHIVVIVPSDISVFKYFLELREAV